MTTSNDNAGLVAEARKFHAEIVASDGGECEQMRQLRELCDALEAASRDRAGAVTQIVAWHRSEAERIRKSWEENKAVYARAGSDAVLFVADAAKWHDRAADAIERGEYLPGGKSDQGEKYRQAVDGLNHATEAQINNAAPLSRSGDSALVEARKLLMEARPAAGPNSSPWWDRRDRWLAEHPEVQQHEERK